MARLLATLTAIAALVVLVCLIADLATGEPRSPEELRRFMDQHELLRRGGDLSADDAAKLEAKLEAAPNDLESRLRLLGYYFRARRAGGEARLKHVLWMIRHHPDSRIAANPELHVNQILEREAYSQAKAVWLEQVDKDDVSAAVLGNAARFFLLSEQSRAEELLKKAQTLEPHAGEWSEQLGHLYMLRMTSARGNNRRELANLSLAEFERAADQHQEERARFHLLPDLAKTAFEAGDAGKANRYATTLLELAQDEQHEWNAGNSIHHGNLMLGRLALQSGDIEKAKSYRLAAGQTTGSPQLNSFGPNMMLAKELLERGETQAVLEYFEACSKFWKHGANRLNAWREDVEAGAIPEFGANLRY